MSQLDLNREGVRDLFKPTREHPKTEMARISAITVGATLAFLIVVATLVRFFGISAHPMYDEAASWTFARLPWISFWKVMWNYEGYMVLYYLLLRAWVHLGDSEIILRSLSVFFGAATILALYDLGARLFNRRTGLIASALLAIHAFHIAWSQQARSYTLLILLLVISTSLLISALREPQARRAWAGYVIISALACYCHVLAVLVLIAQWLWVGATVESNRLRHGFFVLLGLVILIVPTALFVILQNNGQEDWVPPLTARRFIDSMRLLAGGTEFVSQSGTALLGLSTALGILGAYFGLRSRTALHSATMLVVFWLLFPIGALAALSLISPIFVNRYLLMCIPALILLVSFALDRLLLSENIWLRWAGAVAGSMIFVLSSSASFVQYRAIVAQTSPFRDMTRYIATRSQPDDAAIFFTPSAHLSFIYYASFATSDPRKNLPKIVFPNFGDTPSGAQPIPSADEIRSATKGYRRVWLVLNFSSISYTSIREAAVPVIWSTLLEEFDLSQQEQIGVFLVGLFVRK